MGTKFNIPVLIILVVLITVGAYSLLGPPAEKPTPNELMPVPREEVPAPEQIQPIPGVASLDVNQYKSEPIIRVWISEKGYIESIALERYLEGVIAREMEPDWPVEALAAQAITARTLTIHALEAGTIKKMYNADVSTAKEELQACLRPNLR